MVRKEAILRLRIQGSTWTADAARKIDPKRCRLNHSHEKEGMSIYRYDGEFNDNMVIIFNAKPHQLACVSLGNVM